MRREPKLFSGQTAGGTGSEGFRVEPRRPGSYERDEDDGHAGRGFIKKVAVGVVLLGVLGVGGWQAMALLFGGDTAESGDVPLFTASNEPFKHRPDEPGGMQVPMQESEVFDVLDDESGEEYEVILPPPEEPIALPEEPAEDVADVGAVPVVEPDAPGEEGAPLLSADEVSSMLSEVMAEGAAAPAGVPVPGQKPDAASAPAGDEPASPGLSFSDVATSLGLEPAAESTAGSAGAAEAGDLAVAEEEAGAAATAGAGSDVASLPAGDGVARVQIAAYSSREAAATAWKRLAAENADLLGEVDARVMETMIAGQTFHRLQVGAYSETADAQRLCDALRQRQIDCMVVGP